MDDEFHCLGHKIIESECVHKFVRFSTNRADRITPTISVDNDDYL